MAHKPEFPPLLQPGFHRMTLTELRSFCVDAFPLSTTRAVIMKGLEEVTTTLVIAGFTGELWVDGSFLTEKIDPEDADIVLCAPADFHASLTADRMRVATWFVQGNLKDTNKCDCYFFFDLPARPGEIESRRQYWTNHFGVSRTGEAKGIAIVLLPDGAK